MNRLFPCRSARPRRGRRCSMCGISAGGGAHSVPRRAMNPTPLLVSAALAALVVVLMAVFTPEWALGTGSGGTHGKSTGSLLESVHPPPQGWVSEAPQQVILRFWEPIQPAASRLAVSSSEGPVEGTVAFPDAHTMAFQFRQPLGEGTYYVEWSAALSGGRAVHDRFHFTYLIPEAWEEPMDRRQINRLLGNLLPSWLLWLPAALGVGALIWGLWTMWRDD